MYYFLYNQIINGSLAENWETNSNIFKLTIYDGYLKLFL